MSQLTKQQLKGENQTQFPNNNVGAITPSNLRAFNVDMIDSTVNQTDFTNFSGSVAGEIDTLQAEVLQLQNFSASLSGGFVTEGELAAATGALEASIATKVDTTTFNAYTQSTDAAIAELESWSSSLDVSAITASSLQTASFGAGTLTFTKGDGTTFGIVIPDVSGSTIDTGSFATTGSNSFDGNQIITGSLFISSSAASDLVINGQVFISSSATGGTTRPQLIVSGSGGQTQINRASITTRNLTNLAFLNPAYIGVTGIATTDEIGISLTPATAGITGWTTGPALYGNDPVDNYPALIGFQDQANWTDGRVTILTPLSASTGFTASLAEGNIWVGNSLGQNSQLSTSSFVSSTLTGSFATTGSNTFNGQQIINLTGGQDFAVIGSGTDEVRIEPVPSETLLIVKNSDQAVLRLHSTSQTLNSIYDIQIDGDDNTGSLLIGTADQTFTYAKYTDNGQTILYNKVDLSGSLNITGSMSASLQQGYTYVGDANGRTALVSTSSFVSSTLTGSFATTGSNTFIGNETFQDAGGNFSTLVPTSGSLMLVAKTFNSASGHLSASAGNLLNLIFKTNNLTGDTIISGSGNIITNPNAAAGGFKRYLTSNNWFTQVLPAISSSMAFSPNISQNIGAMVITMRGPVSASLCNIASNMGAGNINIGSTPALNAEKLTNGWNVNNNQLAGNVNIQATQTPLTGSENMIVSNNLVAGAFTFQISSSAAGFSNNQGGGTTIVNNHFSGSPGVGRVSVTSNSFSGTGNTIRFTGSMAGTYAAQGRPVFGESIINGALNQILIDSVAGKNAVYDSLISGEYLIVSASSPAIISEAGVYSTTMIGRFNANDGIRNTTSENIFVVGTGISGSRKTGFLIDSGSNTFIEGTLNVSGATSLNGDLVITGSLTASLQQGFTYVGDGTGRTIAVATSSIAPFPYIGNAEITGGLEVSGGNEIRFRTNGVAGIIPIFDIGVTTNPGGADSIFASAEDFNFNFVGDFKLNGDNLSITGPDVQINLYDTTAPAANSFQLQNSNSTFRITAQNGGSFPVATFSTSSIDLLDPTRISGSLTISGSLYIQSGSTLPVSTGSAMLTWNAATGQVNQSPLNATAEFWSTITESGSAGVSGSITFNNSGSVSNVSLVNGTELTIVNPGIYNIQFSAQIETSAGADTMYMWFKKNGTNIGDSASKAVLANNTAQVLTVNILDEAQANDYYEIAYQNINGHAKILAEAASGNIPAIPSVIATVFQVR